MPRFDVDAAARHLGAIAQLARSMPPSWRAGIAHPVVGPGGRRYGSILPGRGFYLDADLKTIGITKPIPGVIGRSRLQRTIDRLMACAHDDRGTISSAADIRTAMHGGKANTYTCMQQIQNNSSLWTDMLGLDFNTQNTDYAAIPGGSTLDSSFVNALNNWGTIFAPTGTDNAYLSSIGVGNPNNGAVFSAAMLVDILVAAAGISLTSTSSQTVNTTALSRYTSGAGVLLGLESSAQTNDSTTAATATITYTNTASSSKSTSISIASGTSLYTATFFTGTPIVPLAAGDVGLKSVQTVTLSAVVGTGSDAAAVLLYYPLTFFVCTGAYLDFFETEIATKPEALIPLQADTVSGNLGCLSVFTYTSTFFGGTPFIQPTITIVRG